MKAPSRNSVGCNPTENINRRIVEAIKARMPWGLGRAMTIAREMSMAVHRRPDQWGSNVPGKTKQRSLDFVLSWHLGDRLRQVWRHFLFFSHLSKLRCPDFYLRFSVPMCLDFQVINLCFFCLENSLVLLCISGLADTLPFWGNHCYS